MSLKTYHDLKEMLCEELDEITRKGELTAGSLDTVDKLTHSIKSLEAIIAMNEAAERGESEYYPHWMRSYENDRTARRGRSYAQRRDAMGRYSRDDDGMIEELRELMQNAPDEHTRKRFQSFIRELENA